MRRTVLPGLALTLAACLSVYLFGGCGTSGRTPVPAVVLGAVTSVTPSATGVPNAVAAVGSYEFVSVQGTGQIFTYNVASGAQVLASAYTMPCKDPSGMVVASIGGANVMAVVCYDTGSLMTLTVQADGSLTALGSVGGLSGAYPGTALDGTNVLVPIFGQNLVSNGGVVKVSIATPATPVIAATATLASPVPGGFANPGYLTVANGYIYVTAGSESAPSDLSSTIQVVNESTMTLVGSPLVVAHSPQQVTVQNGVAYVSLYDATELETIDVTDPANLKVLQVAALTTGGGGSVGSPVGPTCHALPVAVRGTSLYAGCYEEATIQRFDVSNPAAMKLVQSVAGVYQAQRMLFDGDALVVPASTTGGAVYRIALGTP